MTKTKRYISDEKKALLIRWWSVGAVYFFIGWGTQSYSLSTIDFVFILGTSIGVFNIVVVNPVIHNMFNLKSNKKYTDTSVGTKVIMRLKEIFKSMFIVFVMLYIYEGINRFLIHMLSLPSDSVPFPGEPITFGIIYIIVFVIISKLVEIVKKKIGE